MRIPKRPVELARAPRVVCRPATENVTRTRSRETKWVPRTLPRTISRVGFDLDAAPEPTQAVAATIRTIAAGRKNRRISSLRMPNLLSTSALCGGD
jgi:hypothetical protein